MTQYDIKRLGLILAVQAEIEGMKAANSQYPEAQPYSCEQFEEKAFLLKSLSYANDEQL